MLGKLLWQVFGYGGPGFPILVVVVINFGTWVYKEILVATGGDTQSVDKLKKLIVVNTVLGAAIVIVNGIFNLILPGG